MMGRGCMEVKEDWREGGGEGILETKEGVDEKFGKNEETAR